MASLVRLLTTVPRSRGAEWPGARAAATGRLAAVSGRIGRGKGKGQMERVTQRETIPVWLK